MAPAMPMAPKYWHSAVRYLVKAPHRLDESRVADASQCRAPDDAEEDVRPRTPLAAPRSANAGLEIVRTDIRDFQDEVLLHPS